MFTVLDLGALGHRVPFEQACDIARTARFHGIDLDIASLRARINRTSLEQAQAWFASFNLQPGAFHLAARWRDTDSDEDFARSLDQTRADAHIAAAFGCRRCVTWVMPGSAHLHFDAHWARVVPRLREMARALGEWGIQLGLEFVGTHTLRAQFAHDFVHTLDGARALIAAIDAPHKNVGLLLDAFHWFTSRSTPRDLHMLRAYEVIYVHVNDAVANRAPEEQIDHERELPGASGVIDLDGFFSALRAIACVAPVAVEPFNTALRQLTPLEAARTARHALSRWLPLNT